MRHYSGKLNIACVIDGGVAYYYGKCIQIRTVFCCGQKIEADQLRYYVIAHIEN